MAYEADTRSKWYPYHKIYEGYFDLKHTVEIPRKIMDYILDMPNGTYTPPDDNDYPRARLWKYLYYDGAHPLDQPLPTPAQKMSVLFNPDDPTRPPDPAKGFRLIPQLFIKPAQTDAQTRIYVYLGNTLADNDFTVQMSVVFDIWTHYTEEANTHSEAYSRAIAISQALLETFHGVNIDGVGSFYFNRTKHSACGERVFDDGDSNVGRRLVMGLEIKSVTRNDGEPFNGKRIGNGYFG